ncbi:glycosyltransferase family 4 protein [Aetokthonos hydrillicola Thurmond2011]|jgi:glycosyltransferase involved in cell wall biosynthesis|uniref:Glycosyltransferase family 4 protein n=1 Tax=Aetokthonos hydrillicola Thurmond2011 TaxID=2712845 RepID=A0AAP5I5Q7_9CYAN|nr:glycosyltransferase family 4 protein [Aetokthonos hydrillicola]MBO3460913.1 glycosyltransferase family 4 protein [Aetokthonos hydrillicola CCALA 1050]MBW4586462.1 glycosyltransferase family 4 protein [Aetokthonos hydrillicola CCALA 1050]MDR9893593.1 glycosyltransferase family 4 protein [Aetokthonos hydrillicola Thurmond2011]
MANSNYLEMFRTFIVEFFSHLRLLIRWNFILVLHRVAQILQQNRSHTSKYQPRKVVHISPKYFSEHSYIGGGERYPTTLAQTMAHYVETVLITFGETRNSCIQENLRVEVYRKIGTLPDSIFYLWELVNADVVHCHQYKTTLTNLTVLISAILGKRIFVTDHGGWANNFSEQLPIDKFVDRFLTVSDFSAKTLALTERTETIYGGVAQEFIDAQISVERQTKILFVGRLLPHKGIDYLIEAVDQETPLDIVGRIYDEIYFSHLKKLASNKRIRFITHATDNEIVSSYLSATVTILPSVYVDMNGMKHPAPELLGLVLLESMACGTPVICTNVGGMPEIVVDGVTGFVVPPNEKNVLKDRINYLINHPNIALNMGKEGRQKVLKEFTWDAVTQRCLSAYSG